ncbi:2OG-Fe(II) oxygenase [Cyanophage S-RIM50]|uniref:2OG-Fe(II) oxygenase superfamily protein n=1 Tax=Cyanophage S-RIM50 TaxID=687803 RepID=A0A127KLW9_9CAUD|nr:2OG-Fe(II) oxygenase [Cyanophage S-RIM50]AMO42961.1 2OG-Fe(II) oxygenase superfamily protein [Cyanophage S-RIM50]
MGTELKDFIRVYDGVLEEGFCKTVIESFNSSDFEYFDREQRPSFSELNISKKYLENDKVWMSIQAKLQNSFIDAIELYMKDLDLGPDFPSKYAFEEFRIKMYNNNDYDQFKDHVDVGNYNSARRFLVCFLYLNDVEVGGETNFPKLTYSVSPKCGRILLFPATWQWRHAGLPPLTSKKYIVGTYLHYV